MNWTRRWTLALRIKEGTTFTVVLQVLRVNTPSTSPSILLPLTSFLDDQGIVWLEETQYSKLRQDERFSIILPKVGPLAQSLIHRTHFITCQGVVQPMLQTIPTRY